MIARTVLVSVTCGLILLVGGLAFAQTETGEEQITPDASQVIDQIQHQGEQVVTGQHFAYDPANRRDPFEPLIKSRADAAPGKRPKGVAGMLVSEIALKGIALDTVGSPVAMFNGTDNRGYYLRVGDIVYDGRVISIDNGTGIVVFRQQVDDPRRIKPYRDVVKRLYPLESTDEEETLEEDA